jgi:hypothetical protein
MILRYSPLLAALLAAPALAGDDDLRILRQELAEMRASYENRIAALEQRLAQAEQSQAVPAAAPAARQAANAFNPELSAVLGGTVTRLTLDPTAYRLQGFIPPAGEIAPPRRGFGLGESELSVAANIDPSWRGQLTFALAPEGGGAEVEEAFIQSLGLGGGATLKAGRFLSGIGYMNEQHAHAWDFADAPLAYKAFLGNQLRNDGVQLKWLAPTELFVELGAEAAAGGAFPATDRNKNGTTLGAAFVRSGGDIGIAQSWRAGLSAVATSPRDRAYNDLDATGAAVENSFSGKSRLWIADFVWKWAPGGNAAERALNFQAEYFRRRESGELTYDANAASLGMQTGDYAATQSGWYTQGVYKFQPQWRVGYRYDRLSSGATALGLVAGGALAAANFPLLAAYAPTRHTVMLDYATSEFARFRLQLAQEDSRLDAVGNAQRDRQVWLQYLVNLGAHGAHKY